MNICETGSWAT